jgi:hypothetical protein
MTQAMRAFVLGVVLSFAAGGCDSTSSHAPDASANPAPHRLGANVPIPTCTVAGTILTCNGTGELSSWQANAGVMPDGGAGSVWYQSADAGMQPINCSAGQGILWTNGVPSCASFGQGTYGDGSDGAVTADGTSTVTCLGAPSADVYTLTRDCFFSSLTVQSAATIQEAGYRIFVAGTATVNGHVSTDGGNGVSGSGHGAGGGGGTVPNTPLAGGATGGATGAAGGNVTNSLGGAGGAAGSTAGGTQTAPSATYEALRNAVQAISGYVCGNVSGTFGCTPIYGGAGGGAYGGGTPYGGGGGGGYTVFVAEILSGSGSITANGGTGAGGGGGGVDVVVYHAESSWTGTATANGGATTSGGSNGSNGTTLVFQQ